MRLFKDVDAWRFFIHRTALLFSELFLKQHNNCVNRDFLPVCKDVLKQLFKE